MSTSHSTYSPAGKSCVMEPQGWVPDESWSSFDLTMAAEESKAMAHLFGAHQYLNEQDHNNSGIATQQMFWDHQGADNSYYSSEDANCNPYVGSQGNCSDGPTGDSSDFLHTFSDVGGYYMDNAGVNLSTADEQATRTSSMPPFPFDSCHSFTGAAMNEEETNSDEVARSMEPIRHVPADHSWQSVKRMLHDDHAEKPGTQAEGDDNQLGGPKKKARRASVQVSKKGKNVQSKRQPKCASVCNDADSNADMNAPSSSCYSSEDDDSSALQDPRGAGSKNGGKPRADRGSATDPQSLYARKRRERINERLRILQNLVPNGTKVDISTMLEEAVKYVKFLQLQIKLLSSDEMWMYAPIAYNGMNLGFDLKIPAPSQLPKGVDAAVGKKR